MALACITGAAHLAAGAALLGKSASSPGARSRDDERFVLLINVPNLLSSSTSREAWTALFAEGALVGAAWIVAAALRERPEPQLMRS